MGGREGGREGGCVCIQHILRFHIDRAERITVDGSIEHRAIDG